MSKRLAVVILGLVCLLTACTLASVGGRYADWYAMKKIDDYFDLSREQKAYLEPRVKAHVAWIKTEELSQVSRDLDELATRAKRGLQPEDVAWVEQRILRLTKSIDERLRPDALWLLTRLDAGQRAHAKDELASDQKKWLDRLKETPERYREKAFERYEKTYKDWFGSISEEQRRQLHRLFAPMADLDHAQLYAAGRLEAQSAFLAALEPPIEPTRLQAYLTTLLTDPGSLRSGEARRQYAQRLQLFRDAILAIDRTLTPEQRRHLTEKLQDYRGDVDSFRKVAG